MTRVGIFCDVQSLWFHAKVWRQGRVDYSKLRRALVGDRFAACCYAILTIRPGMSQFERALQHIGYDTVVVQNGKRANEMLAAKVENWLDQIDTVVVATGDGRYSDLFRMLRSAGKTIEVHAFPVDCSLKEIAPMTDSWVSLSADVLEVSAKRVSNG